MVDVVDVGFTAVGETGSQFFFLQFKFLHTLEFFETIDLDVLSKHV